jgi:hypothetical protein
MKRFEISVPDIFASEFQTTSNLFPESVGSSTDFGSFLPKDYESLPIFSYDIDTTKSLTWDTDAKRLHELWMQNAKNGSPHDQYPHAAIKRLMRLNPEVFQVCSEVLAPFSLLADMFVGMLLLGASGDGDAHKQPTVLTEKQVIHSSIAPNPLLIWALDAINIDALLDVQPNDYTIIANMLPELLVRQYPKNIKKKLIEAHFRLLDASEGTFGEIPQFIDASGHAITRSDVLGPERLKYLNDDPCPSQTLDHLASVPEGNIETEEKNAMCQGSSCNTDNQLMDRHTEKPHLNSIGEILDLTASSESHLEAMCQDSDSHAVSSQMEYVRFFSHIDPLWFSGETEEGSFETQLQFAGDRTMHLNK